MPAQTAAALAERGYRTVGLGRSPGAGATLRPPAYKLVAVDNPKRWLGLIEGVASERGREIAERRWHRKQSPAFFVARGLTAAGTIRSRAMPGEFETVPAAAHALVDAMERGA